MGQHSTRHGQSRCVGHEHAIRRRLSQSIGMHVECKQAVTMWLVCMCNLIHIGMCNATDSHSLAGMHVQFNRTDGHDVWSMHVQLDMNNHFVSGMHLRFDTSSHDWSSMHSSGTARHTARSGCECDKCICMCMRHKFGMDRRNVSGMHTPMFRATAVTICALALNASNKRPKPMRFFKLGPKPTRSFKLGSKI